MKKEDQALTQEASEVNTDEEPAKAEAKAEEVPEKKAAAPAEVSAKKEKPSTKPFKAEPNANDVVPYKWQNSTYEPTFPPKAPITGASKIDAHSGTIWNKYKGGDPATAVSNTTANATATI